MKSKVISTLIAMGLTLASNSVANAMNSFDLNSGTPTCAKAMAAEPKNQTQKEIERVEYEADRICDSRWPTGKYGEPVWLGSEPPHPTHKSRICKKLAKKFYDIRRKRSFADTYRCTAIYDSKWNEHECGQDFKFPPLAEKSAQILEKAVKYNCYFY